MRTQLLDLDEHACLWPSLTVHARHIDGPEDVTVASHPALGLCIVSHHGFSPLVEWMTREAIPDDLIEVEVIDRSAPVLSPFEAALASLVEMIARDASASPA
jgi:hypothetical protein